MTLLDRFDDWVQRGPFTPADLGIYRIVYALSALLIAPDIGWLRAYPDFMFHPPPGPLQLLSAFPAPAVLIALEVLRSATLVLLGVGLWTRWMSIAAALMLTVTYGLTYCLGKVDHTILVVVVPLVLAFANWGERFSVDANRRKSQPPQSQAQWPLRLLAIIIGWGFFTAALTKILTGWLSTSSQAARGYFVLGFLTEHRTFWLAEWVAAHDVRAAWELVDWATVLFEAAILLAVPWWRAFRTTLAIAATFHLGVLLVMDIDFSHAVVAYGAFVSWSGVAQRMQRTQAYRSVADLLSRYRAADPTGRIQLASSLIAAVSVAGIAWWLMISPGGKTSTGPIGSVAIIFIGAAIGISYLIFEAGNWQQLIRRRRSPDRSRSSV